MIALGRLLPGGDRRSDPRLLPQGHLSGPMPWVISIMIALTVVAAGSGLALRNAARTASADIEGGITVQIVSAAPAERDRQARAALASLQGMKNVRSARRVAQSDLEELMEPWLGTRPGDDLEALPIPALIDVRLAGPASAGRLGALRATLQRVAPAARVDAQSSWLAPVFGAIAALQWLAGGLIALLAFAAVAAVLLASRNALASHHESIEIVHMLGGTDRQIARVFQRGMAVDAAVGGLAGFLFGSAALLALGRAFAPLGSGLASGAMLGWTDWLTLCAIPLGGIALAVVTARLTVLAALREML